VGIEGLCIVSNSDLGNIVVLEEFGLGGRWICKGCLGSNSGVLLTGLGSGGGYIWAECDVRGLLEQESG
jgi:hypothetical protein